MIVAETLPQTPSTFSPEKFTPELRSRTVELLLDASDARGISLSRADALEISHFMRCARMSEGERFRFSSEGTTGHGIFFLLYGEVSVQLRTRDRAPVAWSSSIGVGEFVGLISAFAGVTSPAVVRVNESVVFAVLSRQHLSSLEKTNTRAHGKLLLLFANTLAKASIDFMARFAVMDRLNRSLQVELAIATPAPGEDLHSGNSRSFLETFELR